MEVDNIIISGVTISKLASGSITISSTFETVIHSFTLVTDEIPMMFINCENAPNTDVKIYNHRSAAVNHVAYHVKRKTTGSDWEAVIHNRTGDNLTFKWIIQKAKI